MDDPISRAKSLIDLYRSAIDNLHVRIIDASSEQLIEKCNAEIHELQRRISFNEGVIATWTFINANYTLTQRY